MLWFEGFSYAFLKDGWEVVTVDIDPKFNSTICKDIRDLTVEDLRMPDRKKNSMVFWYPLIKDELLTPKTVMIEVDTKYVIEYLDAKNGFEKYGDKIE